MFESPEGKYYASRHDYEHVLLRTRMVEEGWALVEGFSRYVVSPQGEILNASSFRPMSVRQHRINGALSVSLMADEGRQSTVSAARIVALAYIPLPQDSEEIYYDVGYLDGNNQNIHVDNLVWVARWRNHTGSRQK